MSKYMSIRDTSGRQSTLDLAESITVIGVLPHGAEFKPSSIHDATLLRDWLTVYIKNAVMDIHLS